MLSVYIVYRMHKVMRRMVKWNAMSNTLGDKIKPKCCNSLLFKMCRIIILGKIKAVFQKIYFRNVNAIVLVFTNVFIVS